MSTKLLVTPHHDIVKFQAAHSSGTSIVPIGKAYNYLYVQIATSMALIRTAATNLGLSFSSKHNSQTDTSTHHTS